MLEPIFNLFAFVIDEIVEELGYVIHHRHGPDDEKLRFLRQKVNSDLNVAKRLSLPMHVQYVMPDGTTRNAISYRLFSKLQSGGRIVELFEEVFAPFEALSNPLMCITPIVDGKARPDYLIDIPQVTEPFEQVTINHYDAPHFLTAYVNESGFDVMSLLNNDYFRAIRHLFQAKMYVSCTKLLMSFIDTISFLHEGDKTGNFQRWFDEYVPKSKLSVTGEEVWEFRNSLLHMTNLDSRKVIQGKVRRLSFFVGQMPSGVATSDPDRSFFELRTMIFAVTDGVAAWVQEFNNKPGIRNGFLSRYEKILSDSRYEIIEHA